MITAALIFFFGIALYSFIEYAVHRWILHGVMWQTHIAHHTDPRKDLMVPAALLAGLFFISWWLFGPPLATGMLVGWFLSGSIHKRIHSGSIFWLWLARLRAHHDWHHCQITTNYGVTSQLWDTLFGTKGN